MHSKQIKAELSRLMENLQEQFNMINEEEGVIPRIEIDLMMSTLRTIYEQVYQLNKLQEKNQQNQSQINQKENTLGGIISSPSIRADVTEKESVKPIIAEIPEPVQMESISFEKSEEVTVEINTKEEETPSATLFTPLFEIARETQQKQETVAFKEEQPLDVKTEKVNISISRNKPLQTAGLFDEVTTVAESYSVKTTLHDKMSTGRNDKSVADNLQMKPLTDLKKSIGINEKFVFVRELFEGDHQLFSNSIEKLNSFSAYEQARRHLFEELATPMNWNKESKAFQELNDLVKRRFNS